MKIFDRIVNRRKGALPLTETEELDLIARESREPDVGGVDIQPEKSFSPREWVVIATAGITSFLLFVLLLLPYDLVFAAVLNRFISPAKISYSSLDFNLFAPDEIVNFQYSAGPYILLTRGIVLDVGLSSLLFQGALTGDISVASPSLQMPSSNVTVKTLNGNFNLSNLTGAISGISGNLSIQAAGVDLSKLNLPNIPVPLNELVIKRIVILGDITNGSLQIRKGSVQSNLFDITLSGRIFLASSSALIRLENRLCLKATPEAEASESGLYGLFVAAGGSITEESCFNITGTLQSPSFQRE